MAKKISEDHLPIDGPGRKELETLYAMTEDQAIEQTLSFCEKDHPPEARFPIQRWTAAHELKQWHDRYKHGDKTAILESLYLCTLNDLSIPSWLTFAYLKTFRDVIQYKAKSWDDVFGKPHPKSIQLEAKREEREKSLLVYRRVKELLKTEPNIKIKAHFKQAGEDFGIGSTTKASDWYYEWKERLASRPAKT